MVIGVPRELQPGEQRAAMIPASIQKLVRAGAQVVIESGLGLGAGHSDEDYATAGAHVTHDRAALLAQSELVLRLHEFELRVDASQQFRSARTAIDEV